MNVLLLRHNLHEMVLSEAANTYAVLDASAGCRALPPSTRARFAAVYDIESYDSLEELSAVAADLVSADVTIDAIVSFAEFTQYAAGYLGELLHVSNVSARVVHATRDKRVAKALADRAGLPVARWCSLPELGPEAVERIVAAGLRFPIVVKPAGGWGSVGVVRIDDRSGLTELMNNYAVDAAFRSRHLIAEEFMCGDEFHIDAVWRDGEPWVFFVSRYFQPRLQGLATRSVDGSVLLPEALHADIYTELRALHAQYNEALGVRSGATHLEVFQDPSTGQFRLSDIASRVGGANVGDVIKAHCGMHIGLITLRELLELDRDSLSFTDPAYPYVGLASIMPDKSGTVVGVASEAELTAHPQVLAASVLAQAGAKVEADHPAAWCVLLVLGAASEQGVADLAVTMAHDFAVQVDAAD